MFSLCNPFIVVVSNKITVSLKVHWIFSCKRSFCVYSVLFAKTQCGTQQFPPHCRADFSRCQRLFVESSRLRPGLYWRLVPTYRSVEQMWNRQKCQFKLNPTTQLKLTIFSGCHGQNLVMSVYILSHFLEYQSSLLNNSLINKGT